MTTQARPAARGRTLLDHAVSFFRGAGLETPAALAIIAASIAAPILIRLSAPGAQSDITVHAAMAAKMVESGGWLSYTLWYPLIYITSSGSADPVVLREISVFFLVGAVVAKVLLVYYIGWACTRHRGAAAAIAVLILVAMPLLNPWRSHDIYLGQLSPNAWHNSTQIFALPFSLAAFIAAVALLRVPTKSRALTFGILIFLSTITKPNYTIALFPVLGIILLWTMRSAEVRPMTQFAVICIAFLPTALLLADQYLLVFGSKGVRKTNFVFAPFAVWETYSASVPISIGLSIAGPLAVLLAVPRKWRTGRAMTLAWAVLVFSVLQLALLAEKFENGSISMEGNFFWGSYSAIFMVFVVSAIALARAYLDGPVSVGRRAGLFTAFILLSLHVATGLYYLGRAGVSGFPVH